MEFTRQPNPCREFLAIGPPTALPACRSRRDGPPRSALGTRSAVGPGARRVDDRPRVDRRYRDPLGNLKPVISFRVPEYSLAGAAFGFDLAGEIFTRLGAEDHTAYDARDYSYVEYAGRGTLKIK